MFFAFQFVDIFILLKRSITIRVFLQSAYNDWMFRYYGNRISSSSNIGGRESHDVRDDHDDHDDHGVHDVQLPAHILWLSSAMVCELRLECGVRFRPVRDEQLAPLQDMERA